MLYLPSPPSHNNAGQGLVEYALILILVAIVVIVAQATLASEIGEVYQEITNVLADN